MFLPILNKRLKKGEINSNKFYFIVWWIKLAVWTQSTMFYLIQWMKWRFYFTNKRRMRSGIIANVKNIHQSSNGVDISSFRQLYGFQQWEKNPYLIVCYKRHWHKKIQTNSIEKTNSQMFSFGTFRSLRLFFFIIFLT